MEETEEEQEHKGHGNRGHKERQQQEAAGNEDLENKEAETRKERELDAESRKKSSTMIISQTTHMELVPGMLHDICFLQHPRQEQKDELKQKERNESCTYSDQQRMNRILCVTQQ